MIPNNSLSQVLVKGDWLENTLPEPQLTIMYSWGGAHLQDPTQGLHVQIWTFEVFEDNVYVESPNTGRTFLFTAPDISEIYGTFYQNMQPFVAFVGAGQAQFWWFDTTAGHTVISSLPVGSITPRCALDDIRRLEAPSSDIILAYVRNDILYYRQQRDRYTIERVLREGVSGKIVRMGMNVFYRLQFKFQVT